ncbi:Gtr1/RagA G protein conserved region-domain-containing protein [Rhodotorula diobovata]|uniref:GTP-binding protein n=1 Tax=Rhodotorula diobovata TaxID=5288 RepID=A0A5C5FQR5_9BASI|nr:Gtr1/RagA G protein conserved region-domain-containing protein [Rhodotorula diobovata]
MSSKSRKKVLLMGKSGSGKTSMRAIIFKSQLAADTRRLGATIDVESSQIKFLGGLRLDLWDCGGQESFMDSHLTAQSSTVFRAVHSLIYIFDAESTELLTSDTVYFLKCLRALQDQNPTSAAPSPAPSSSSPAGASAGAADEGGPTVFVLLHKMDLVPVDAQQGKLAEFEAEVTRKARESGYKGALKFYGTSIWNETLYKAWSIVISHLMPSLSSLRAHLNSFLVLSSASEIVLFERTTFLVISSVTNDKDAPDAEWDERRFERISTMVKAFKLGCSCVFHLAIAAVSTETGLLTRSPAMLFTSSFAGSKIRSPFSSLAITTPRYTAVLDALTPETYILVVAKGQIQPASIELNIRLARPHFAKLESIGMGR